MKIEPTVSAYLSVRRKKHGIGEGSRLRAIKMALCMFSLSNGVCRHWYARFALWLAIHGTPRLRAIRKGEKT